MTVPVHLKQLRRKFGSTVALDGLDLEIAAGEMVALLGPSGCGKTTALRIVAGFETADGGELLMGGEDVTSVPANRRDIGMVFQSYSLFPNMTAAENIAYGLRVRGRGAAERRERAGSCWSWSGCPAATATTRTSCPAVSSSASPSPAPWRSAPRVLLLDEPLSALDAKVRLSLREEIRRIQLDLGITTVFVTHDQEEALSMADRVAVMKDGRLEQCAAPGELYDRPATPFVAEFVGTMNRLPGTVRDGGVVELFGRRLPIHGERPAAGAEVDVLLRPEGLAVGAADDGAGTPATVRVATFLGPTTRLHLTTDSGAECKADLPSWEATALAPGARCTITPHENPVLVAERAGAPSLKV